MISKNIFFRQVCARMVKYDTSKKIAGLIQVTDPDR
jgi:hypothetical protein